MDNDRPRLFLIDGYALIYRAYFALLTRPLTTRDGLNTNAPWGVLRFLEKIKREHGPDYLGFVMDAGDSQRTAIFPDYKATREKMPEEMRASIPWVRRIVRALGIPVLELDGYEADDVIGTLARKAVGADVDCVIVSGDKDFHQLVRPGVSLLNPGRGGRSGMETEWVDTTNGHERLGVAPEHVTDYLALIGDSSDNIPGARGIGPKTACTLIETYGAVERILERKSEVAGKRARTALEQCEDDIRLSKRLVTIMDALPVELDLGALRVEQPELETLIGLLDALEFDKLKADYLAPQPAYEQGVLAL